MDQYGSDFITITDEDGEVTITNTLKPFRLVIEKTWEDATLEQFIRPEDLKVTLYRTAGDTTEKVDGSFTWTKQDDVWTPLLERHCIGFCYADRFPAVTAQAVRLRITEADADGSVTYYRQNGIHYVQKRALKDIIL